ncbi:pyridoxine 5'-phosphate synthase [Hymenobacter rubripertinctus]|uniref:Pyridoxine 5'-phosphate synthase n=1 Tax=Hymenobacter rubripertinctus TaxID=2029981 RepID=A0A418R609_9BACT|nr:pyridoxine 5'-phosphate synthase [Hymenobacter rubripertinctus]RIY12791.1 pyridoxine 5'-phosphate synthase [Hymenobacter rubripertinctus]
MTKLSVNINKIATLRNARGHNRPNLLQAARDIERFGAQGITVHPRPDERHIRYQDVRDLKAVVSTELNVEGNPTPDFLDLVREVRPEQVTLVPDAPDAITSNAGWNTVQHQDYLRSIVADLKSLGCRVSIFLDPVPELVQAAATTGTDRIELYTEDYARHYHAGPEAALRPYREAAAVARQLGLGLNAGHDLDLDNLAYMHHNLPGLQEVSIGHALVCDALYLGLENTVQLYRRCLSGLKSEK